MITQAGATDGTRHVVQRSLEFGHASLRHPLLLAKCARRHRAHHIDALTDDAGLAFGLGLTALPKDTLGEETPDEFHLIKLTDDGGGELSVFIRADWSDWDALVAKVTAFRERGKARFCAHANIDGDASRCSCTVLGPGPHTKDEILAYEGKNQMTALAFTPWCKQMTPHTCTRSAIACTS